MPITRYQRPGRRKIGLAGVEDEPGGLCDASDLLPSLFGAVLRPPAPRQRVPSLRARRRTDAELRAGHRRKTRADRLHLGSVLGSRRDRRREVRCLAAGDLRLHPPLSRSLLRRALMAPRTLRAERSHKGACRPARQKRRLAVSREPLGSRTWLPAEQNGNPLSRDVAAECLRQADGPPAQGRR